jgi:PAS domain S-box-containing protein
MPGRAFGHAHICHVFETEEEYLSTLVSYFKDGLRARQKALFFVEDGALEAVERRLREDGLEAGRSLELRSASQAFLPDGRFDRDRMVRSLAGEADKALREGFSGLRLAGRMDWALGRVPEDGLAGYEGLVEGFLREGKAVGLCQYDARKFRPEALLDILEAHPALFAGSGVVDNPHFIEPGASRDPREVLKARLSRLARSQAAESQTRRAIDNLRISEEKFKGVIDNIGIGVSLISPSMEILSLNARMRRWFPRVDCEARPLCYRSFNDPPREGICSYCPTAKTLADGEVHEAVTETPSGGGVVNYRVLSSPIRDSSGRVVAAVEMVEDITERKKADLALRESEERFRTLFDSARDGLLVADAGSKRQILCNAAACRMLGYTLEEFQNLRVEDIHPAESRACVMEQFERQARGEIPLVEVPVLRKDGSVFTASVAASPIVISGKPYLLGIFRDVSERRAMEGELKAHRDRLEEMVRSRTRAVLKSEAVYRGLFESLRDGLVAFGLDGRVIECNRPFAEMLGYSPSEAARLSHADITPLKWRQMEVDIFKSQIYSRDYSDVYEKEFIRKDGSVIPVACRFWLQKDEAGVPARVWGLIRDVTERRKDQEELRRSKEQAEARAGELEKAAADLGRLNSELEAALKVKDEFVSTVSHEIKTPMTAVKGSIGLLLTEITGKVNPDQRKYLEMAVANVDRLSRLIGRILDFQRLKAGKAEFGVREDDLNAAVREVVDCMALMAEKKGLGLFFDPDEGLPPVAFDKDRIIEVLMNLIDNSIKATEKGGVAVLTRGLEDRVRVTVKDTGRGFDKADVSKLFKQFSQIGRKAGGAGLGLAICKEIIKAHKGSIWAESEPHKGTSFHFELPAK